MVGFRENPAGRNIVLCEQCAVCDGIGIGRGVGGYHPVRYGLLNISCDRGAAHRAGIFESKMGDPDRPREHF